MCAATVNGSEDVNDCGCNKNLVIGQQAKEAAHDALVDGMSPRTTPGIGAPLDDLPLKRRDECPSMTVHYPQTETNDIANEWHGPSFPDAPDLSRATTLEICRGECQEWAKACGFNLVKKGRPQSAREGHLRVQAEREEGIREIGRRLSQPIPATR